MPTDRYSVRHAPVSTLFTWITSREIAIREIQRSFVWDARRAEENGSLVWIRRSLVGRTREHALSVAEHPPHRSAQMESPGPETRPA
jgi:hypothetical protein